MVTDHNYDNTYCAAYPLSSFWNCHLNRKKLGGEKMKRVFIIGLLLIVIAISGCYRQKTTTQPITSNTVEIKGFAFNPATITVSKGTTVAWVNNNGAPHTITTTIAPVDFDSGRRNKGDTFNQTFNTAGTYEYFCSIHPNMKGKVIVTE
jgi:plastocyanin